MPQIFLLYWVEPNKFLLAGVMNQTVARDRVGQGPWGSTVSLGDRGQGYILSN